MPSQIRWHFYKPKACVYSDQKGGKKFGRIILSFGPSVHLHGIFFEEDAEGQATDSSFLLQ